MFLTFFSSQIQNGAPCKLLWRKFTKTSTQPKNRVQEDHVVCPWWIDKPMATSNLELILPLQHHTYHTTDKHLLHLQHQLLFLARLSLPKTTMSVQGYICPAKPLVDPNSSPVHWAGVPADQAARPGRDKRASGLLFSHNPWALLNQAPPSTQQKNPRERWWKEAEAQQVLVLPTGTIREVRTRDTPLFGQGYTNQMIFSSYTSLLCLPQAYVTHTFTFSLQQ